VAVVTEPGVAPYKVVLQGFRAACPCRVLEFSLAEARAQGFERRLGEAGAAAVLAIGMPAREAVSAVRGLPVVAVMAPRMQEWAAGAANRFGISLAVSPQAHLEAIRLVYPGARRVGVIYDPAESGEYVREALAAAPSLGLELLAREAARPEEVPRALTRELAGTDVLWLLPDPTVLGAENLDLFLLDSFQKRLPIHAFALKYVELGAVSALNADLGALGRQAGRRLERRLQLGAGGGEPRFAYARGFQLVLNGMVARKMGIALPAAALEEAAHVVH